MSGRPTASYFYNSSSSVSLLYDMETPDTFNAAGTSNMKDVGCAGTTDSRNGNSGPLAGTRDVEGVEGRARNFNGTTDYIEAGGGLPIVNAVG
ncbi:MAG TPA: hypothetical protein VJ326_00665 [Thermoplasmata archaeon]|nr:hypothetical protein [Thermoplasmata archaeon]